MGGDPDSENPNSGGGVIDGGGGDGGGGGSGSGGSGSSAGLKNWRRGVTDAAGVGGVSGLDVLLGKNWGGSERWDTERPGAGTSEERYGVTRWRVTPTGDDPLAAFAGAAGWGVDTTGSSTWGVGVGGGDGESVSGGRGDSDDRTDVITRKKHWLNKQERRRQATEKRGVEGAEGRWVVRLASRAEAARLVRGWHMREFWTGLGGPVAEKVVMRAEVL